MGLRKLYNESALILELQTDTIRLINACHVIAPIKKLIECHEVLSLSLDIIKEFSDEGTLLVECDEQALLHLLRTTRELAVHHYLVLPNPDFGYYTHKVIRFLTVMNVPRNR